MMWANISMKHIHEVICDLSGCGMIFDLQRLDNNGVPVYLMTVDLGDFEMSNNGHLAVFNNPRMS